MRDHQKELDEANLVVLGISFDTPEKNRRFAEKFDFKFSLLSDTDRSVAIAYGAAKSEKAGYASRMSYLVDEKGHIFAVFPKVSPTKHLEDVLDALKERG